MSFILSIMHITLHIYAVPLFPLVLYSALDYILNNKIVLNIILYTNPKHITRVIRVIYLRIGKTELLHSRATYIRIVVVVLQAIFNAV